MTPLKWIMEVTATVYLRIITSQINPITYSALNKRFQSPYLTIKSNSDPASIRTPSRVENAPSNTGANICSRARTARLFLSPMAVRNAYERNIILISHNVHQNKNNNNFSSS